MIKLFRKIRQKILAENKLSKYLIYAIGEIILVVIGILIALSINNWNERRKEKELEKELVSVLITDLKSKKAEFVSDLAIGKTIIKQSNLAIEHWKLSGHVDTLNLKNLISVIATDGWYFSVNSPIYATISGSGLWKELPDSLTHQIDDVYRMRFNAIKVAFERQGEYGLDAKLNFIAPNHLLDLSESIIEVQRITQNNDSEFISYVELFKSGVIHLTSNFEITIPDIDRLIKTWKSIEQLKSNASLIMY